MKHAVSLPYCCREHYWPATLPVTLHRLFSQVNVKHSALMEAKRILEASQADVAALEATAKVGENITCQPYCDKSTQRVLLSSLF